MHKCHTVVITIASGIIVADDGYNVARNILVKIFVCSLQTVIRAVEVIEAVSPSIVELAVVTRG